MHPLLQQVRSVAHQARRLVVGRAFAQWLCIVVAAVFVVGMADYIFRYRELPLRWLSFGVVVSIALWSWWKLVGPALSDRWSDRQVAQSIERHFPELRDQLSSAVAFLHEPANDPRFGSSALRADVVRQATAAVAGRDLKSALDERTTRHAWWKLGAAAVVVGAFVGLDYDSSALAARRLAMPWRNEAWPRKQHLEFTVRPEMIARGEDFYVELVDENGRLPADVSIWYWFEGDDESAARAHRMTFAGGKMTHRLPTVTRSFRYRAVGGDDLDMPWERLQVVVPPKITASRITLQPPSYTGWPTETCERRIRALAGTVATFEIRFDKPIQKAVLRFKSQKSEQRIAARISADGGSGVISDQGGQGWTLSTSGTYGWELTAADGLKLIVDDNTEIDVAPDLPPVITSESQELNVGFLSRAVVPLRFSVKDDLAIHRVQFRSGDASRVLAEYPAAKANREPGLSRSSHRQVVEYAWDLSALPNLQPGSSLPFEALAEDFLPQTSQPASGLIRVISETEFEERLNRDQGGLLELLKKALQLQRPLQSQTRSLTTQLESERKLNQADAAVWPVLEPGQRRVAAILTGDEGATQLLQRLLRDLSVNRWEAPELVSHLKMIHGELTSLSDKLLPEIQRHLAQADRWLRFDPPDYAAIKQAWIDAAHGQEQVIAALESLVDQLGHWDRYRNLAQEVRQVVDDHRAIAEDVRNLPTAGRDVTQLTAEERAKQDRLAQRLNELAAQIDRLQSRLDQLHQRLGDSNPAAAKSLKDALDVLEHDPIGGDMREAARSVAENRLGTANRKLETTQSGLKKLLATLERQPQYNSAKLEQLLNKALTGFVARQETQIADTTSLQKQPPNTAEKEATARELAKAQQALAQDVSELAQRTPEPSGYTLALELGAQLMKRAAERLAKNQVDDETIKTEHEALDYLKDLLQSLASERADQPPPMPDSQSQPPSNQDSPAEQPSVAELKLVRLVQLELLRRTAELERARAEGGLSEQQQRAVEELATRQSRLAELLKKLESPAVPAEQSPSPLKGAYQKSAESTEFVLVAWIQDQEAGPTNPPPKSAVPGRRSDRALLDDLPPATIPKSAGEDLGQPSSDSPLDQLSRQMRQAESRLRNGDTSAGTQLLQRRVAAQLTTLIEEMERQQSQQQQSQPQDSQQSKQSNPKSSEKSGTGKKPGSGSGGTTTEKESASNWTRSVWGVLPDRVRQQIQDLGEEQFLPEYEDLIRRYYDRLSQRSREER